MSGEGEKGLCRKPSTQSHRLVGCLLEVQLDNFYRQWQDINQKNNYENWVKNARVGSIYDATKSGCFDMRTIDLWFFKRFLPVASQMPGRKVLVGDNLGSYFFAKLIQACKTNDILSICLPPNSTNLCQPLDVAVFRAVKVEWKDILDTWCCK